MNSLFMQRYEPADIKQSEEGKLRLLFTNLYNLTENFLDQDPDSIANEILTFLESRNHLIRQIDAEFNKCKTKLNGALKPGDLGGEIKEKARRLNSLDQKILSILTEKKQQNIKEMSKIADNRNRRRRFVKARIIDICQE